MNQNGERRFPSTPRRHPPPSNCTLPLLRMCGNSRSSSSSSSFASGIGISPCALCVVGVCRVRGGWWWLVLLVLLLLAAAASPELLASHTRTSNDRADGIRALSCKGKLTHHLLCVVILCVHTCPCVSRGRTMDPAVLVAVLAHDLGLNRGLGGRVGLRGVLELLVELHRHAACVGTAI